METVRLGKNDMVVLETNEVIPDEVAIGIRKELAVTLGVPLERVLLISNGHLKIIRIEP